MRHLKYRENPNRVGFPRGNPMPIRKIDEKGNTLAEYASIAEAARENYMHKESVARRARGQAVREFAGYGFSFRFIKEGAK